MHMIQASLLFLIPSLEASTGSVNLSPALSCLGLTFDIFYSILCAVFCNIHCGLMIINEAALELQGASKITLFCKRGVLEPSMKWSYKVGKHVLKIMIVSKMPPIFGSDKAIIKIYYNPSII